MSEGTVFERMVAILSELPAIGKNQKNAQQGFMFRGHDDVLNALNPLLAKHGVFVVPDVLERITDQRMTKHGNVMYEVNLHVRFTFYGEAGDSLSASTWGEGTDSGDKSTNKAMTMAFKNVLNQAFSISTVETPDADRDSPEESLGRTRTAGGAETPTPQKPDASGAAPASPPASPPAAELSEDEKWKKRGEWWDSKTLADCRRIIENETDPDKLRVLLTLEGERKMRGTGDPRVKAVTVYIAQKIKDLDGEPPATTDAPAETSLSPETEPGEDGLDTRSTSPGSTNGEVLRLKAALGWIQDQPSSVDNPQLWSVKDVLWALSQRGGGTYGLIEEIPPEWLEAIWVAIPEGVRSSVELLGPEAKAALAARAT